MIQRFFFSFFFFSSVSKEFVFTKCPQCKGQIQVGVMKIFNKIRELYANNLWDFPRKYPILSNVSQILLITRNIRLIRQHVHLQQTWGMEGRNCLEEAVLHHCLELCYWNFSIRFIKSHKALKVLEFVRSSGMGS